MAVIIIVIVILIFFAVASLSLLSVRRQFAEEATYLETLEHELRTQTCAPAAFYQIIKGSIPNTSMVFERVDIVFRLTSRNVLPNLSEISELAIGSKEVNRGNQFVNFALSALLVSGLGGTFLAF